MLPIATVKLYLSVLITQLISADNPKGRLLSGNACDFRIRCLTLRPIRSFGYLLGHSTLGIKSYPVRAERANPLKGEQRRTH
jgi:hypothetical protein